MKKIVLCALAIKLFANVHACDRCSLSLGTGSMQYTNYIGFSYQANSLSGFIPYTTKSLEKHLSHVSQIEGSDIRELYSSQALIASLRITNRFVLEGQLPFVINQRSIDNQLSVRCSGIGDPTALLFFRLKEDDSSEDNVRQWLSFGAGVKFPLGQTQMKYGDASADHDMQPGSGSFDMVLSTRYLIAVNRYSVSAEAFGILNTPNLSGYQYGNELRLRSVFSAQFMINNFGIRPSIGSQSEWHKPDFSYETPLNGTGATFIFATAGMDFTWKNVSLSASGLLPVFQQIEGQQLEVDRRINFELKYLFNKS